MFNKWLRLIAERVKRNINGKNAGTLDGEDEEGPSLRRQET